MKSKFLCPGLMLLASSLNSCSQPSSELQYKDAQSVHRYVHWNIKEIDSTKIDAFEKSVAGEPSQDRNAASKALQVKAALQVLNELKPEFLSLNEIQYDVDKMETPIATASCDFSQVVAERRRLNIVQNDDFILSRLQKTGTWDSTFCPANTGALAQRDGDRFLSDRPFDSDPDFARKDALMDKVNFGWTPGQYSTVFASSTPIKARFVNAAVTWTEWNPELDITGFDLGFSNINYRDSSLTDDMIQSMARAVNLEGDRYKKYPLFDKNFNVSWVQVDGRDLAMVTFHTVPAFGFDREGKSVNPNPQRNKAQLEFLEWYILGQCEPESKSPVRSCQTTIRPLGAGASFIVAGDLNVAIESPIYPGSQVLQRILTHPGTANARLQERKFGLPVIPKDKLPAEVVAKIEDGSLTTNDFGGFHPYTTFIPYGFDFKGRGRSRTEQLDYFIVSQDIDIKRLETHFVNPEFKDHGCFTDQTQVDAMVAEQKAQNRAVDVFKKDKTTTCLKSGTAAYGTLREGSDHLPLILEFGFR
ncbi:MAG: hypothetical protein M3Q07_26260 [Pseudobdellovibrionaceae bacterium]|nr:hypothetical protein [Pseudobdellovibrionaceae bacterium]